MNSCNYLSLRRGVIIVLTPPRQALRQIAKYSLLHEDSIALVAREKMFFVRVKSLDNLGGKLPVK